MSVLLMGGSPTEHSRSAALLDAVAQRLREQVDGRRLPIDRLRVRDMSPQALLLADWGSSSAALRHRHCRWPAGRSASIRGFDPLVDAIEYAASCCRGSKPR